MSKKYTYKRKSTKLDALTLERGYGYTVNVREGRLPIHGSSLSKADFKLSDYLEVEELTETVKPTLAFIFSLGLAIESDIIRILTNTFGEDALNGLWGEDKALRDGVVGDDLEYNQFSFGIHYKDKPMLMANADALLKLDGKYHVVEIKSTNAKDFELIGKTKHPLDNALRQSYLYHLLITSGKTNAPKEVVDNLSDIVKVVYVNKTPQMFKNFIHVIDVDVSTIDPHIKKQINGNFDQVLAHMEELYEVHYGQGEAEDE
jgi:hypothetical protein